MELLRIHLKLLLDGVRNLPLRYAARSTGAYSTHHEADLTGGESGNAARCAVNDVGVLSSQCE